MKFQLDINIEDISEACDPSQSVARMLRELAGRIEDHPHFSPGHDQAIYDAAGREVGHAGVYGEPFQPKGYGAGAGGDA